MNPLSNGTIKSGVNFAATFVFSVMNLSVQEPAYACEMQDIDPDLVQNISFFELLWIFVNTVGLVLGIYLCSYSTQYTVLYNNLCPQIC